MSRRWLLDIGEPVGWDLQPALRFDRVITSGQVLRSELRLHAEIQMTATPAWEVTGYKRVGQPHNMA